MADENKKVILVDDDDTNNFISKRLLQIYDPKISVTEFIDPEAALASFRNGQQPNVKLVLLDINMPKINAWQFLESLGAMDHSDIIILTSSIDPKDRLKAKELDSVKGFWTKPLSLEMINGYFSNNYSFFL